MSKNPFQLPSGRILGPSFFLISWLSFQDNNTGKNCFATHTFMQIVYICANNRSTQQNIEYAAMLQKDDWA